MCFKDAPRNEITNEGLPAPPAIVREKAWPDYGVAKASEAHKRQSALEGFHGSDEGQQCSQILLVGAALLRLLEDGSEDILW